MCLFSPLVMAQTISLSMGNLPPIATKAIVLVEGGSIPTFQPVVAASATGGNGQIALNLGVPPGGPYRAKAIAVTATGAILRTGQLGSISVPSSGNAQANITLQDVTATFESATPSSAGAGSTVPIRVLITDPGDALAQPSSAGLNASFTPFTANDSGGSSGNNTTTPLGAQQYRISINATLPPNGGTWFYQVSTQAMQFVVAGTIPTFYYPNLEAGQSLRTLTISGPPTETPVTLFNASAAQVVSGGGWKTTLTVVNLSPAQNSVKVNFRGDDGHPLTLPLVVTQQGISQSTMAVDRTLEPGATLLIESEAPASSATVVGWAEVVSSGLVSGFGIFRQRGQDGRDAEGTARLESSKASSLVLPFDNTAGFATGVALVNLTKEAITVNATIRDDNGPRSDCRCSRCPRWGTRLSLWENGFQSSMAAAGSSSFRTRAEQSQAWDCALARSEVSRPCQLLCARQQQQACELGDRRAMLWQR